MRRCATSLFLAAITITPFLGLVCVLQRCRAQSAPTAITAAGGVDTLRVRPFFPALSLSQTRVEAILQDDTGFIWIATQFGLNRLDGFHVRKFFHDSADPSSIACSYVQSLFKDRSGRIWASCGRTLDLFNSATETFTHFQLEIPRTSVLTVLKVQDDAHGVLWMATSEGLISFDPHTRRTAIIDLRDQRSRLQSGPGIQWIEEGSDGQFWAMTQNDLVRYDRETHAVLERHPIPQTISTGQFHRDRWGRFWVVAQFRLYTLDRARGRLTPVAAVGSADGKPAAYHHMMEDSDGAMWFGTEGQGLFMVPHAATIARRVLYAGSGSSALPSSWITALFQDHDGDVWTGFHDSPPVIIQTARMPLEVLRYSRQEEDGFGPRLTTSIFELSPDALLLGAGGHLQLLQRDSGRVSAPFPLLDAKDVFNVHKDNQGRLWFATDKGVFRADRQGAKLKRIPATSDAYRFLSDSQGRLWVLSRDELFLYRPEADSLLTRMHGAGGEHFFALAEAPDHALWIGGDTGLIRFDPQDGSIARPQRGTSSAERFNNSRINALLFDRKGRLWVGTQSGLGSYDLLTGRFDPITSADGLGGQIVSCIQQDTQQHLWMSSNQGLLRFDPQTRSFLEYTRRLGGPAMDMSGWGACASGAEGTLYFGGFSGVLLVRPAETARTTPEPRILFTQLVVNVPHAPTVFSPSRQIALANRDHIALSYEEDSFTIDFATLDFRSPYAWRYRFRVAGSKTGWQLVPEGQHSLSFFHLSPGRYTIYLEGASELGTWPNTGTSITLSVAKPWWLRWWMIALYLLAVVAALWLSYCYRVQQVAALITARAEGRTRERTSLARQIHDTLLQDFQGIILRFASAMHDMPQSERKHAEMMSALTRAEEAIENSRDALQDLRTSPVQYNDLRESWMNVVEQLAFLSAAQVSIQVGQSRFSDCNCDADEMFQIGREAIRNALQHAEASRISIVARCDQRGFELTVADDGVGIPVNRIDGEGLPGHWGIRGMRERAERLGGTLEYLRPSSGGTVLRVILPRPDEKHGWFSRLMLALRQSISSRPTNGAR